MRHTLKICLAAGSIALLGACADEQSPTPSAQTSQTSQMAQRATGAPTSQPAEMTSAVAGATWNVPDSWTVQEKRPMRVATYHVAPASGDTDPGECAIFYFGAGEGGSVEMNLARWAGQFEGSDGKEAEMVQSKSTINGLEVTTTSVSGTYLASMGPMFQSGAVKKTAHKMLGAIIAAPDGNVFFKFTGPGKTIDAANDDFAAMIQSVRKK